MDEDSDWTFQTYYDRAQRHYFNPGYGLDHDLIRFGFPASLSLGELEMKLSGVVVIDFIRILSKIRNRLLHFS